MESLPHSAAEPGSAGAENVACYVQPAPVDEVLIEQLDYLLVHAGGERHPDCRECRRLERVRRLLLEPFGA